MAASPSSLRLLFCVLYCYQQLSLIHTLTIKTSIDHEYENKTINCHASEPCVVICQNLYACKYSTIHCPAGYPCDIICNSSWACWQSTIHAKDSSFFQLLDCATGTWTCVGLTIYFPTNNHKGMPLSKLIGADLGFSAGMYGKFPLQFYAVGGWNDVNISHSDSFKFNDIAHVGIMYCLKDYSVACNFSLTAWSCANPDDFCNDPYTRSPTKLLLASLPTGAPSTHESTSQAEMAHHSTIFSTFQSNEQDARDTSNDLDILETMVPVIAIALFAIPLIIAVGVCIFCWFRKRNKVTVTVKNMDAEIKQAEPAPNPPLNDIHHAAKKEKEAKVDESDGSDQDKNEPVTAEHVVLDQKENEPSLPVPENECRENEHAITDQKANEPSFVENERRESEEEGATATGQEVVNAYDDEGSDHDNDDEELYEYEANVEVQTTGNNTTQMSDVDSVDVADEIYEPAVTTKGIALHEDDIRNVEVTIEDV